MPTTLSYAAWPGNIQQPITAPYSLGFRTQEAATAASRSHMQQAGGLSACHRRASRRSVAQTDAGSSRRQPPRSHTGSQARSGADCRQAALQLLTRLLGRASAPRSAGGARAAAKRQLRSQLTSSGQRLMRRRVHTHHWLSIFHLSRPRLRLIMATRSHRVIARLQAPSCPVCRQPTRRRSTSSQCRATRASSGRKRRRSSGAPSRPRTAGGSRSA